MPTKSDLQKLLKSAKIEFKKSETKESLMEKVCLDNELKKQLNTCGLGDIHSCISDSKFIHKGSVYEKIAFKKDPSHFIGLFKKDKENTFLVVKAHSSGSGLGKGGSKWTFECKSVKF